MSTTTTSTPSSSWLSNELLTAIGMIVCIACSINGSNYASSVSGAYMTRYCHHRSSSSSSITPLPPPPPPSLLSIHFWKPFIPIVISGVLAIYGFLIAIIMAYKFTSLSSSSDETAAVSVEGYKHLVAGCCVGFSCYYSGVAIHDYIVDYYYYYESSQYPPQYNNCPRHLNGRVGVGCRYFMTMTDSKNHSDAKTGNNKTTGLEEPLLLSHQQHDHPYTSEGGAVQQENPTTENESSTLTTPSFPEPTIHFCMTLVYLEAIGLYGFIIALLLLFVV